MATNEVNIDPNPQSNFFDSISHITLTKKIIQPKIIHYISNNKIDSEQNENILNCVYDGIYHFNDFLNENEANQILYYLMENTKWTTIPINNDNSKQMMSNVGWKKY